MDNKRLIPLMLLVMTIAIGWQYFLGFLYDKNPQWKRPGQETATTQPVGTSTQPVTSTLSIGPNVPGSTILPTTGAAALPNGAVAPPNGAVTLPGVALAPAGLSVGPADTSGIGIEIGSVKPKDKTYPIGLRINPRGAGLEQVVLNAYKPPIIKGDAPYTFQQPYEGFEDHTRPLGTREVTVNGQSIDLSKVNWTPDSTTATSATFTVTINDAKQVPVVRLSKVYEVFPHTAAGEGYEIVVRQTFENLTPFPVVVRAKFNGPTTPPRELEHGLDRQVITGYSTSGSVTLGHRTVEEFTKDKTVYEVKSDKDGNPALWSGQGSVYFNAVVLPIPLGEGARVPTYLDKITAEAINPDSSPETRKVAMTFETTDMTLAPASTVTLPMNVFFGPKIRALLKSPYYGQPPRAYDQTLLLTGGCTICTFQTVVDVLVWLLATFHALTKDWGLAIILLVVLVRLLLHPITKKSTINMQKMTKLGPEAERLKKKYGDNKEELNRQMMQLYKSQGFTPVLGCLPMFLQMPIWIALYSSLQSTFELRQQPFFYNLTWIKDLAKPDHLITFEHAYVLPLGIVFSGLNILPILLAVVFWIQAKVQPKAPNPTREQAQQQKMMQWMVLLFPIFLYSGPAGLNIYILTSTTIGIIESKLIRKHIEEREAAEKELTIVDGDPPKYEEKVPKSKGKLAAWVEKLQQTAEQVQKDQQKKKKK